MTLEKVIAKMPGQVVDVLVAVGDSVKKGQEVVILEAMKMENAMVASKDGVVTVMSIKKGDIVSKNDLLFTIDASKKSTSHDHLSKNLESDQSSKSILALRKRRSFLLDENRKASLQKRTTRGQQSARKNIAQLVDENTFIEYGSMIVAAQQSRRTMEDLIKNTPADGLITGRARVEGVECLIMAYDFTVLAGTQGTMNHLKMDRMIALAKEKKLPVFLFAEGGGGRPGDVDQNTIAGLFISTFLEYAALKGEVVTIAIVSGYCFAGNAALAGASDVIIGTKNTSIGMGGPAMIEGGGLGKFHPRDVGPADVQFENGVIDILVDSEKEAIEVAKTYFGYFVKSSTAFTVADQEKLQNFIPSNRKRVFEIRDLVNLLFDEGSFLEIQGGYAKGMLTGYGRIEGKPCGIIGNDGAWEAGAITALCGAKAAAFLNHCSAFNLPMVAIIDTPGIMVGPQAEKQGTVKAAGSLFVAGAKFQPPFMSVVVRRAYGLGAMAMMGGSTRKSEFTISWPSGEFGAMGLEGAVRLGYRKELEEISDPEKRKAKYNEMVAEAYKRGEALSMATMLEIDDVVEPKETRKWIAATLQNYNYNN